MKNRKSNMSNYSCACLTKMAHPNSSDFKKKTLENYVAKFVGVRVGAKCQVNTIINKCSQV